MAGDPFGTVDLRIEYVDSAAGSRKTLTAMTVAVRRARLDGIKTIFCMPTLELVREMAARARRADHRLGWRQSSVPVVEITSAADAIKASAGEARQWSITAMIHRHITGDDKTAPAGGHLLFITHEAFLRMGDRWPDETAGFEIIIDETPEIVLTRAPFRLRDNSYVLSSFLEVVPARLSPIANAARKQAAAAFKAADAKPFTDRDEKRLLALQQMRQDRGATEGEEANAKRAIARLLAKKAAWEQSRHEHRLPDYLRPYYQVVPRFADGADPWSFVKRRAYMGKYDDIYTYSAPVAAWLLTDACVFTDRLGWERMVAPRELRDYGYDRGLITISGFRRPDALKSFARATIMSALFPHTLLYQVWEPLGVEFVRSAIINVAVPLTFLGSRYLRIFWLTDQGWSKRQRDRAGGIGRVFELIKQAGVIDENEAICVVTNKDDATEDEPRAVRAHFPRAVVMPHNAKGQNRWRHYHQLIHTAAFNPHGPDIVWMETVLGIGGRGQRIGRLGQEVYQSLMRLSLRVPTSTHDVTLIVMDKDVAEWLPQWFEPADQVIVQGIDSEDIIARKGLPGRPRIGHDAMSAAERQARRRQKKRDDDQDAA